MNESSKSSNDNLGFHICLLLLNVSVGFVLLFTSFRTAIGVTNGNLAFNMGNIEEMLIQFIVIISILLVLNITSISLYKWVKNGARNPFRKKKTIGEIMKEKSAQK